MRRAGYTLGFAPLSNYVINNFCKYFTNVGEKHDRPIITKMWLSIPIQLKSLNMLHGETDLRMRLCKFRQVNMFSYYRLIEVS